MMYNLSAFHIVKVICLRFSIASGRHWLITISEKLFMDSPPFIFSKTRRAGSFFP